MGRFAHIVDIDATYDAHLTQVLTVKVVEQVNVENAKMYTIKFQLVGDRFEAVSE